MPTLETKMHLTMLENGKQRLKTSTQANDIYGLEWGDPSSNAPLIHVRDHFLMPFLLPSTTVLEIGPGGGRWTRYMLDVKQIYAVDFHQELLDELKSNFDVSNITQIKNNGDDFPNIPNASIDFLFSFGVFVHLDIEIIARYLENMKPLLKAEANVVIQYSDKTKALAKSNSGFSDNNPDKMRELILSHGYSIFEEDLQTMVHSSIIRFGLPKVTA